MKKLLVALIFVGIAGCTSVDVRPLPAKENLSSLCIYENPRVTVPDFLQVLIDGFERHAIATKIVNSMSAPGCNHVVTYTALRSWDMNDYLSHAEVRIMEGTNQVAYARYHLNGKGGLSLTKWASVKSKMDPVIDKLLASYELPK